MSLIHVSDRMPVESCFEFVSKHSCLQTTSCSCHQNSVSLLFYQAMQFSSVVEISDDLSKMRTRNHPDRWAIVGNAPSTFSSLKVDVPEFIPGKAFSASQSGMTFQPGMTPQLGLTFSDGNPV